MSRSRALVVALVAVASLGSGCTPPAAPTTSPAGRVEPPPPQLPVVVDTIFTAYFEARPVTATALGEHAHDGLWPLVTAEAIAADRKRIEDGLASLAAFDPALVGGGREGTVISVDERVDVEILRGALEQQLFEHDVEQPWATDPFWYAGVVGSGLDDLISRDFAPLEERATSLASRLELLPAFLEQASAAIVPEQTKMPQTEVAITQLDGVVELIRTVIPTRVAEASDPVTDRIAAATSPALMAVRTFQEDLRTRVLPHATGSWRLGAENFERKLALTLSADMTAAELRRLAVVEHGRVRKQMATLAYKLAEVLFSRAQLRRIQRKADRSDVDSAVVSAVLHELGAHHVQPDALRDTIEATLARLLIFVEQEQIVALDAEQRLQVIWTPPHQRGVFIAGLAAPGPLEQTQQGLPSFYLVQPLPKAWAPEVTASYLREYNNFMLEILSIHEAIPGHFVQQYYARKDPSKVRRVFGSNPLIEGWAVYTEKVMVEAGYAGAGPEDGATRPRGTSKGLWRVLADPEHRADAIALHGLKFYLRTVTNAVLDHAVHTTNMSREEALELMVERSFQEEGEALQKWTRAQVTSCQLSTYFVGAQAWLRLREEAKARAKQAGETFDLAAFHAEALSHGSPPVHTLPDLMGWTAPEAEAPTDPAEPPAAPTDADPEAPDAVQDAIEDPIEDEDEVEIDIDDATLE